MVIGTLRIPLSPDRRVQVVEVLRSIQGRVLAEPGCAACQVYEDEGPEQAVLLIERWDTESALQDHIRSDAYRRILSAIELSGSPPEVRFDYVSATEGMELIERLRSLGVPPDATASLLRPPHGAREQRKKSG